MLDHDEIRLRIEKALGDQKLPLTGKWLKDYGVGQTTLRNFLDRATQSLTLETVAKIAKPLNIDAKWLIFGDDEPAKESISADLLRSMVNDALSEMQPGMSIAEIRPAVAASLREQLARALSGQATSGHVGEESAPAIAAQSPAPTKRAAKVKSRTT